MWEHQLKEILADFHLTESLSAPLPPSHEQVAVQLATPGISMTPSDVRAWTEYMEGQWWSDSTTLYHIVHQSLNLSGPFEEADLRMIEREFWTGDYRLGCKWYQWATSHVSASSVASQSDMMDKAANMKLTSNPTYEAFAAHCSTLSRAPRGRGFRVTEHRCAELTPGGSKRRAREIPQFSSIAIAHPDDR
jgi:hypothetical protein